MPTEAGLRTALGLAPGDSVPGGDPESLVGPARIAMARNRQQMLATMVMMGLQRIVIDSGRLHAAMKFHIDTRSAAADDRGSSFDLHNDVSASGKFGFGPWGAEASVKNTIGYVSTQKTQTTEEMNTDLDLDSSVELVFRSDYVPLERLAGTGDVNRIRVNTLNPEAEMKIATDERKARLDAEQKSEATRGSEMDKRLASASAPIPSAPPAAKAAPPAVQNPSGAGGGKSTPTPPAKTPAGGNAGRSGTQGKAATAPARNPAAPQPAA